MSTTLTAPRARARIKFKPPNTWQLWYWCYRINLVVQIAHFVIRLVRPWGVLGVFPIVIDIFLYWSINGFEQQRKQLHELLGMDTQPSRAAWLGLGALTLLSTWMWTPFYP